MVLSCKNITLWLMREKGVIAIWFWEKICYSGLDC